MYYDQVQLLWEINPCHISYYVTISLPVISKRQSSLMLPISVFQTAVQMCLYFTCLQLVVWTNNHKLSIGSMSYLNDLDNIPNVPVLHTEEPRQVFVGSCTRSSHTTVCESSKVIKGGQFGVRSISKVIMNEHMLIWLAYCSISVMEIDKCLKGTSHSCGGNAFAVQVSGKPGIRDY